MAEHEEGQISDVSEMDIMSRMSRTEEPEYIVNFDKVRDLVVYDSMGNEIKFGDIYKKQKTIIVFVRHFLDYVNKDYVEDLGMIPLEYLQAEDMRLVVIGPAPFKFIADFKKSANFNYTIYVDPERNLYKALNLTSIQEFAEVKHAKHVKQNAFMGLVRNMWKIMWTQEWHGDPKQNGGAFVLGPGDVTHFCHIDRNQVDMIPINDLLKKAGVQLVSFPKDPRVQEI